MARRGRFGTGGTSQNYAGDIRSYIAQSMGTDAVPSEPTGTNAQTPELTREERKARAKAIRLPFSDEFIQSSGALSAVKAGLTYEQALANLRKLTKYMNMVPLEGQGSISPKAERFYKTLTPAQRDAQWAFEIIGGYGTNSSTPGGMNRETGKWETYQEQMFRRLGLDPSTLKNYAGPNITTRIDPKFGPIQSIANPLNATQRARLQRLRSMGSLTKKQSAALARLRAKKNAPTILP